MHELKESQVHRQLFLGDASLRVQPRTPQRPKAFHGVDMDLMETITILVDKVRILLRHQNPI
jgi:hypothetical protein